MDSRDTTVLIDLLWFNVVHYSSTFFQPTMVPTATIYVTIVTTVTYKCIKLCQLVEIALQQLYYTQVRTLEDTEGLDMCTHHTIDTVY